MWLVISLLPFLLSKEAACDEQTEIYTGCSITAYHFLLIFLWISHVLSTVVIRCFLVLLGGSLSPLRIAHIHTPFLASQEEKHVLFDLRMNHQRHQNSHSLPPPWFAWESPTLSRQNNKSVFWFVKIRHHVDRQIERSFKCHLPRTYPHSTPKSHALFWYLLSWASL